MSFTPSFLYRSPPAALPRLRPLEGSSVSSFPGFYPLPRRSLCLDDVAPALGRALTPVGPSGSVPGLQVILVCVLGDAGTRAAALGVLPGRVGV